MSKFCPILNEKVVYLECLECKDKECETPKEPEQSGENLTIEGELER